MIRYSSASGTTVTTSDSLDQARSRGVRTMRLTLQAHDSAPIQDEATKKGKTYNEEKPVTPTRRRKNGHVHSERMAITETPVLVELFLIIPASLQCVEWSLVRAPQEGHGLRGGTQARRRQPEGSSGP